MRHSFSTFELDEELFELRERGAPVVLQPKVLELLFLLVRERGRVVTKGEIMAALWPDVVVGAGSLARATMAARRAIRDDAQEIVITVRGRGLRFGLPATSHAPEGIPAPAPVRPPVAADPPYAGREREDAAILSRLLAAGSGEGGLTWITGEGGMGKTRTVEALCRAARARNFEVLAGRCHESPEAPPFGPWLQITRAWLATIPPLEREGSIRSLGALAPDPAQGGAAVPLPDGAARFRLYDAFARGLVARARSAPLLVVLEDVHRADDASLELLRFLSREIREARVAIVATCCEHESSDAASASLGRLLAEGAAHVVALSALLPAETTRMVEEALGRPVDPVLAAKIHAKSGGNPLYVVELSRSDWLARALVRTGDDLRSTIDVPAGVRASVVRRLDVLSGESLSTLTAASVLGTSFDIPSLAAVARASSSELVDHLEEAARARILAKEGLAYFRFSYPLVRQVLYDRLSAGERWALHRAAADALVLRWGAAIDEHLADLALHLVRAAPGGDADRAVEIATRAGDLSLARGAPGEAASLYERALEALPFAGAASGDRAGMLADRLREARASARRG